MSQRQSPVAPVTHEYADECYCDGCLNLRALAMHVIANASRPRKALGVGFRPVR